MKVSGSSAGSCFVVLSSLTGLYALTLAAFSLFGGGKPSEMYILMILTNFFVSGMCGWAAYVLFKRKLRALPVATFAWVLVAFVTAAVLKSYVALEVQGVRSPETLGAAITLVCMEFVIAVHLVQRFKGIN